MGELPYVQSRSRCQREGAPAQSWPGFGATRCGGRLRGRKICATSRSPGRARGQAWGSAPSRATCDPDSGGEPPRSIVKTRSARRRAGQSWPRALPGECWMLVGFCGREGGRYSDSRDVAATAFAAAKRARIHVPRAEPGARLGAARLRAQHVIQIRETSPRVRSSTRERAGPILAPGSAPGTVDARLDRQHHNPNHALTRDTIDVCSSSGAPRRMASRWPLRWITFAVIASTRSG